MRPRGSGSRAVQLALLLALVLAGVRFAGTARAVTGCPGVITQDTTLTDDIVAQPGGPTECIRFGVGGLTLNLNGHTVDIRPLHMTGRVIALDGVSDITVNGPGTAITTYDNPSLSPRAFRIRATSNLTIQNVHVLNLDATGRPVAVGHRVGRGMDLENVTGGRILGNEVAYFGRGIYFLDGTGTEGFDTVSSNYVHDNEIDVARSFGIGLEGSSGWTITHNRAKGNGSAPNGQGGIEIQTGSNDNVVADNRVVDNLGAGITADAGTSGNRFRRNVVRDNGQPGVGPDLSDANASPSPNSWNPNNRCDYEAGSVPSGVCNPGE